MFIKNKIRATLISVTLVLGLSVVAATTATTAHAGATSSAQKGLVYEGAIHLGKAGDPNGIFESGFLNAWNGGPLAKDYGTATGNDAFNLLRDTAICNNGFSTPNCPIAGIGSGFPIDVIQFAGGGTYNGDYVSDYQNNSGDAKAGLVPAGGWGWLFIGYAFRNCSGSFYGLANVHWTSNWSNPSGIQWAGFNGSQAYLNSNPPGCNFTKSF